MWALLIYFCTITQDMKFYHFCSAVSVTDNRHGRGSCLTAHIETHPRAFPACVWLCGFKREASRQTHTEKEQRSEWKLFLTALTEVATDSSTAEGNGATRDQRGILGEKGKKSNKKVFPLPYFEFVLALTWVLQINSVVTLFTKL